MPHVVMGQVDEACLFWEEAPGSASWKCWTWPAWTAPGSGKDGVHQQVHARDVLASGHLQLKLYISKDCFCRLHGLIP